MDDSFAVQTALTGSEASYADKPDQSYVQVCYFIFATFFVFFRLVESFEYKFGPSQLLAQFLVPGVTLLTHSAPVALYLWDSLPLDTLGALLGLALTAGPSNHCLTTLLRIAPGLFLVHLTGGYWYFYRTLAHSGCTVQRLSPYLTMIGEVCYRFFLLAAWVNSPISLFDFRFSLSGTSWMVTLFSPASPVILLGFKPGIDGYRQLLWRFFLLRGSCLPFPLWNRPLLSWTSRLLLFAYLFAITVGRAFLFVLLDSYAVRVQLSILWPATWWATLCPQILDAGILGFLLCVEGVTSHGGLHRALLASCFPTHPLVVL